MTDMNVGEIWKRFSEPADVLKESFDMLRDNPGMFVPKLISTLTGAVLFVGILEGVGNPVLYLAALPPVMFLSLLTSVILASSVKNESVLKGTKASFTPRRLLRVLGTSLILLILTFVLSMPASAGVLFYQLYGSIPLLIAGLAITLIFTIAIGFYGYFFPVILLEENPIKAYRESSSHVSEKKFQVGGLTVFSLVLLTLAFGSSGFLEKLGYAGFVLGRCVSSIVNTYAFVVSPNYYLKSSS